ncbi:transposable element P transposase isoform X2 [Bicyclus anynana]|uniref:Transposable element P transposase isoform X2 n=1 Tax=Bicyclus anynana TaxID=110368 RepID=A0ABM3LNP0_BICAN|nr:transposable element P transposase isoform X2 [Bicyclus anynana]
MPKLCAFGCVPSGIPMHRFPNANKCLERFKAWVKLVGGKLTTASDYEHYQKKVICDIHFTEQDRNRNKRLNALAVPSLNLRESATKCDNSIIIQPATLEAPNTEQSAGSSSNKLIEQSSTSNASNTDIVFVSNMMQEHNYSTTSKSMRKSFEKGSKVSASYDIIQMKPFSRKIKHLQTEISCLRKKTKSFKARLASATKLHNDVAFQHVIKNMRTPAQLFVHMQLQGMKKPKGRRFTLEEKILALSLYKKSPKGYSLLYKYFTLPSSKAMKRLLSSIKLCPGINPILLKKIKETVLEKEIPDRLCSLIFDEMSLTPQIFFDKAKDKIEGFATSKSTKFADHALVFMIKGLKQNFKQPVAYYFTSGLQKIEMKILIKSVVTELLKSGLIILNTVCDQGPVNVSAITELISDTRQSFIKEGKEWRHDMFSVNGHEIIPLYDVPHLIKGIRNNLITKNMIYNYKNESRLVKWDYYQQVYAADKARGELRLLNKITEEHINPEKINKMRVKSATQIFSHSMAVVTDHLVARGHLPAECNNLVDITLLIDKIFDSLNVSTFNIPNGKIYKGAIRKNSPHHELWMKAKVTLKSIKFLQKKVSGNKIRLVETSVPSVTNLIKTINGMEAICKILFEKYGYDAVLSRNFNQDPVENFFGNIRSYGARNNSPNTMSFEGAFKALLLNNYNLPHSKRANCEEDVNECLQSLHFFLKQNKDAPVASTGDNNIPLNENLINDFVLEPDVGQRNYVCGWVLTKCLKNIVKSCKSCRNSMLDFKNKNEINNTFIKAKEYEKKKWLCYPNEAMQNCFHDIQNITNSFLKKDVPINNTKRNIKTVTNLLVNFPIFCSKHGERCKEYITDISICLIINSWCRSINRILSGKITYKESDDDTKIAAQIYYNKHKKYKNKK